MMYLERVDEMELASSTDVECRWNKQAIKNVYELIPISENTKKKRKSPKRYQIGDVSQKQNRNDVLQKCHDILNKAFPDSAHVKQLMGRDTEVRIRSDQFKLTPNELKILLQDGVHLTICEDEIDAELL